MNRTVSTPVVVIAIIILSGALYVAYNKFMTRPTDPNPGRADIPARQAGDDKIVVPPKDAGAVPGAMSR